MLKKINRVNKEAFKFQFTISYRELVLDCYNNWYPKTVHIKFSRKDKSTYTKAHPVVADPDIQQRYLLSWSIPENQVISATLFRASSSAFFENKNWLFEIYEHKQLLAYVKFNLSDNASTIPKQVDQELELLPVHCGLKAANLFFTISSSLVRNGFNNNDGIDHLSLNSELSGNNSEEDMRSSHKRLFRSFRVKKKESRRPSAALQSLSERYDLIGQEYETSFGSEKTDSKEKIVTPSKSDPSEVLLEWCRNATKGYKLTKKLDNFSTAWEDGLAFCAIIHRYRPHLFNFHDLDPTDASSNLNTAFEAGEKLGIPRCVDNNTNDKLCVITYLYQLQSFFVPKKQPFHFKFTTPLGASREIVPKQNQVNNNSNLHLNKKESPIKQIDKIEHLKVSLKEKKNDSSFVISSPETSNIGKITPEDKPPQTPQSLDAQVPPSSPSSPPQSQLVPHSQPSPQLPNKTNEIPTTSQQKPSPTPLPPSPSSQSSKTSTRHKLMTRKQLYNPFDSDSDEELPISNSDFTATSSVVLPKSIISETILFPPVISVSEKEAEPTKTNCQNSADDTKNVESTPENKSRQQMLRDKARELMSSAAKKPLSMLNDQQNYLRLREQAKKLMQHVSNRDVKEKNQQLYFNDIGKDDEEEKNFLQENDKKDDDKKDEEKNGEEKEGSNKSSYLEREMQKVEEEQKKVDVKAVKLEAHLRNAIETGDKKLEVELLQKWFKLVSYKNALMRRHTQLNIEQEEVDLEKRFTFLSTELRSAMEEGDETREKTLLLELVQIVNARDAMVLQMHHTQEDIDEDEASLKQVNLQLSKQQQNCILM